MCGDIVRGWWLVVCGVGGWSGGRYNNSTPRYHRVITLISHPLLISYLLDIRIFLHFRPKIWTDDDMQENKMMSPSGLFFLS